MAPPAVPNASRPTVSCSCMHGLWSTGQSWWHKRMLRSILREGEWRMSKLRHLVRAGVTKGTANNQAHKSSPDDAKSSKVILAVFKSGN